MGDPTKPDLRISYLEHRSMRADAARLTELLGTAQPADRLQVTRESLTGLATAAGGGRWEREREQAVKAALALKAIIDTHTGDEEAIAFPRYTAHFTAVEYAGLNKAALKLVGLRSFVFAGPWVLDHASPTERAELLGEQPMLLRILYRLAVQPATSGWSVPFVNRPSRPIPSTEVAMPPLPWRTISQPHPDQQYLVMASRLPLRSRRSIPRFLRLTLSVVRQLERTDGLIGYSLLAQPMRKTFWTLSAWTDQQHLDAFAKAMPHLAVIRKLHPRMGPTRFQFWTVQGSALPVTWEEAINRLMGSSATPGPSAR